MKKIYLDHNATTPLKPEVYEAMLPYLKENFGNPSSIHWAGRKGQEALMIAREKVARLFHVDPNSIVFTSGGTEANNLALKGVFEAFSHKGKHIIISQVEHSSILECSEFLRQKGADISFISVNHKGELNLEELERSIRKDTILISIQAANNETGVRMPVQTIGEIAKKYGVLFHCDAVQVAGKESFFINELPIDLVSISGHKMYGPKGAGALIIQNGLKLEALIHGGNQERKRRGGTENVSAIVGFGKACESAAQENLSDLRNYFEEQLTKALLDMVINGKESSRISNTSNVTFKGIKAGDSLLLNLDLRGIAVSMGSACSSGTLKPSHVLTSMGLSSEDSLRSIRFSFGSQNSKEDMDVTVQTLKEVVQELRI